MSKNLWALRTADGRVVHEGFATKDAAKRTRAKLLDLGTLYVTPGPDHKRSGGYESMEFRRAHLRLRVTQP